MSISETDAERPAWLKPGRIPCVIIGCRRTAAESKYPAGTQIICGKCFRLASKHLLRRHRRLRRLLTKLGIEDMDIGDTAPGSKERQVWVMFDQSWKAIVRSATEAKVGISA